MHFGLVMGTKYTLNAWEHQEKAWRGLRWRATKTPTKPYTNVKYSSQSSHRHPWQHKGAPDVRQLRSCSFAALEALLVPSDQIAQPHHLDRPLASRLREELVTAATTPPP